MSAEDTLLDRYDAVLLDLDGTVYHGTRAIEGAVAAITAAHKAGLNVRFVTNNASKAPTEVAEHLRGMGIPAEPNEVATSAQAGASMLAARVARASLVLVVGTDALAAEVGAVGLRTTREFTPEVAAVVQGHSPRTTWGDLAEACMAIRAGAVWVACNVDPTLPTERGQLPGNGSMVAALRTATGVNPEVAGKPAPGLLHAAVAAARARRAFVVGDRLDTDIACASAAGLDALLVLSGVTTPSDLLAAPEGQRPRYLARDAAAVTAPAAALEIGEHPDWTVTLRDSALHVKAVGPGDEPLDLLRALCGPAWTSGVAAVHTDDERAVAAVRALGIQRIG